MYTVYELIDPRDSSTFYIGITDDVYKRFFQHARCSDNNHAKKAKIQELKELQLVFIMRGIEQAKDSKTIRAREKHWIRYHIKQGSPLTNIVGFESRQSPSIDVPTGDGQGRRINKAKRLEILAYVQQHKKWPDGISKQMQRYYRREYPEYFRRKR